MTCSVQDIANYQFSATDRLLLDTNVWFLLYGPQKPQPSNKVAAYSKALSNMLEYKSKIYINILIVSEFINTYARRQHSLHRRGLDADTDRIKKDFKTYRKSTDFKPIANDSALAIKKMLKHCIRISDNFEALALERIVDEFSKGDADFNDQILADLCQREGLTLVTDDGDFKAHKVNILTANCNYWAGK